MDQKKEILTRLAGIRENQQYTQEELDFIMTCMNDDEELIRAAAVLSSEGCLYEKSILDRLFYLIDNESDISVRKALIKITGIFLTACFLEGFEEVSDADAYSEMATDFDDVIEEQLKERYVQAKDMMFQYLVENDQYDLLYMDTMKALFIFGDHSFIIDQLNEVWDVAEIARTKSLMPYLEQYPVIHEKKIIDILLNSSDIDTIVQAMDIVPKSGSSQLEEITRGYLQSEETLLVKKALLILAEINRTPDLKEILQRFCLHENSDIQSAAKRALDIFTAKNFEDYMGDYFR